MTKKTIVEILRVIGTIITAVIAALTVQACTISLSVAKNNTNSQQTTEQTSSSSIDSTKIQIK